MIMVRKQKQLSKCTVSLISVLQREYDDENIRSAKIIEKLRKKK